MPILANCYLHLLEVHTNYFLHVSRLRSAAVDLCKTASWDVGIKGRSMVDKPISAVEAYLQMTYRSHLRNMADAGVLGSPMISLHSQIERPLQPFLVQYSLPLPHAFPLHRFVPYSFSRATQSYPFCRCPSGAVLSRCAPSSLPQEPSATLRREALTPQHYSFLDF